MSKTEGIGQTLLTALLGFMGGGAASVVSLVFKSDERPQLRATLLGQVLAGLSLGVWLGLGGGIYARLTFDLAEQQRLAAQESVPPVPTTDGKDAPVEVDQPTSPAAPSVIPRAPASGPAPPNVASTTRVKNPAPPPKPPARELLHAQAAACREQKERVSERIVNGYYDGSPGDRASDENTLRSLCGS